MHGRRSRGAAAGGWGLRQDLPAQCSAAATTAQHRCCAPNPPYPAAERNATADALTTAPIRPTTAAACNDTVAAFLRSRPDLSTLVQHLEAAGALELVEGTAIAELLRDRCMAAGAS